MTLICVFNWKHEVIELFDLVEEGKRERKSKSLVDLIICGFGDTQFLFRLQCGGRRRC